MERQQTYKFLFYRQEVDNNIIYFISNIIYLGVILDTRIYLFTNLLYVLKFITDTFSLVLPGLELGCGLYNINNTNVYI